MSYNLGMQAIVMFVFLLRCTRYPQANSVTNCSEELNNGLVKSRSTMQGSHLSSAFSERSLA